MQVSNLSRDLMLVQLKSVDVFREKHKSKCITTDACRHILNTFAFTTTAVPICRLKNNGLISSLTVMITIRNTHASTEAKMKKKLRLK